MSFPEEMEEENDRDRPRRFNRKEFFHQPHRGATILVLGILGFVTGIGIILGPMAWIMGNKDLKEIRAGRMDPEGEGLTNAGRICGMIATILFVVGCGIFVLFFAFWVFIDRGL